VILYIVVTQIQNTLTIRRVIWTLLLAGIFLGTINTIQYFTGTFHNNYWGFGQAAIYNIVSNTEASGYRIGGPGLGPNGYGQYLLLVVPLALDRFWSAKKTLWRIIAAWAFFVSVLAIFLTFSRGVFLALIAVLVVMFIRRPPKLSVLAATAFIAIILLFCLPAQFTERLSELTKLMPGSSRSVVKNDVSFRGRMSENISAIQMFLDHPLLGVGLANYNVHYQHYSKHLGLDSRNEERSAHSIYLEIMSELGLVGLFWFVAMQWFTFKGLRQARKDFFAAGKPEEAFISMAIEAAVIGYLFTALFHHLAHPRFFWLLYGIALSIPYVAKKELSGVSTV
jgi:O-antigen ligase